MPGGMCLKSDGFASNLYDPDSMLTLAHYSSERGQPYKDFGYPIPVKTFIEYGLDFQKRLVPNVEETDVTSLRPLAEGFTIQTANGSTLRAKKVVVAVGITHFGYVPPPLASLARQYVSHSSDHHDVSTFRGCSVAIVGAGASAVDLAALMHEAGVDVQLVARREALRFHIPGAGLRPWWQRILHPRSELGPGWRSWLCVNAPLLFHAMPLKVRLLVVQRHLGPAAGWFVKDKVVGRIPIHTGAQLQDVVVRNGRVKLTFTREDQSKSTLVVDHVIAGTGYRVSLSRLRFLDSDVLRHLKSVEDTPVLRRNFETSVPGLYMVGLASAHSFGPLARFACGAGFTARQLCRTLA